MTTVEERGRVREARGWRVSVVAAAVASAWLLAGILLLPDYGPTWDAVIGDYAFGRRILESFASGDPVFYGQPYDAVLPLREPHFPLDQSMPWHLLFPLAPTLSAASCQVFWTWLGWLPALGAHNLVVLVFVALLVFVLVGFVARRAGMLAAIAAALFLLLSPRFFAHAFNNIKDVPETCLYALGAVAAFRALTLGGTRAWLAAGAFTALALAQKANALFLPLQILVFVALARVFVERRGHRRRTVTPMGIVAASGAFLVVYAASSPQLWDSPLVALRAHFGGILEAGSRAFSETSGLGEPDTLVNLHGPLHLLLTTPPSLLLLAAVGCFARRFDRRLRLFLVVWFAVPVARVALPGMRDFDGVRHFLECLPPLAALAGLGLAEGCARVAQACTRVGLAAAWRRTLRGSLVVGSLAPCLVETVRTHPNGTCYFNFFVGGLAGAQERGLRDATDYWASSYWQGLDWLGSRAEEGARVLVPIAAHVARASAHSKLRADLALWTDEEKASGRPLYVMYVTRRMLYGPLVREVEARGEPPVHEIRVQGGVVLRIHALTQTREIEHAVETFRRELRARGALRRLAAWLLEDSAERAEVLRVFARARDGSRSDARALRSMLPAKLHADLAEVLWLAPRFK